MPLEKEKVAVICAVSCGTFIRELSFHILLFYHDRCNCFGVLKSKPMSHCGLTSDCASVVCYYKLVC